MINRYNLITILLNEHGLSEEFRTFLSSQSDRVLLSNSGFKRIRAGFYII